MSICRRQSDGSFPENDYAILDTQKWFAAHVTLDGKPYTLDEDQVRAVIDNHKNTLVTARAGSGKTRVIVAKVTYLVAQKHISLHEIAVFMFNRTAAAEVNQRIRDVKIDGQALVSDEEIISVASTFHKYALDIVKLVDGQPKILDEDAHNDIILAAFHKALELSAIKLSRTETRDLFGLANNFIARAGQKFPGYSNLTQLETAIQTYCKTASDPKLCFYHEFCFQVYADYLAQIRPPVINFNLLMARAAEILTNSHNSQLLTYIRQLQYVMIDEYQDFSYLFLMLTHAIRSLAPAAKLFAVGDDWQAINRFAGSDVDYFLKFSEFFPEDTCQIALATNYRSAQKIVAYANHYMLTHYDPEALPARAFSQHRGKIKSINLAKLRFDATDIKEDGLGDGRFQQVLAQTAKVPAPKIAIAAAKLLKQVFKIIKHHRHSEIMLLHRHNFTTFDGITLESLYRALKTIAVNEGVMTAIEFEEQIRCMTMHKSKGLEAEIVILLEMDSEVIKSHHPHSAIFQIFGDTLEVESADQDRLIYVALTRAKRQLYLVTKDKPALF